jgi:RHH-type transcriptional regulator, rel operon repressor / antitoxin RelB
MASVSLRLPDDVTQRLDHLVALTGRSKTFYMVEAICEHIDDLEDLYLAEQRMIDIRAGRTQTIPLEEVMKRYGMEG